ncbi:MAG: GNAT family N-acetyltransferase [Candidatus Marinimicrobia bacterium]|nr:GNAT family N-acetyltransferase [Candidatus Neomarinimicrobiota bacterium]
MANPNYRIKEFLIEDHSAVYDLWKRTQGIFITTSDTEASIGSYLERNPGISQIARDRQGKIVGAILGGHDGARGYIRHLAVADRCRGVGLGSQLVETVLSRLSAVGIIKCTIFVEQDNPDGKEFWIKNGWHRRAELVSYSKFLSKDITAQH